MKESPFDRFIRKYGILPTEVDPDYLELVRMGKYRILDVPDVAPGKCSNCGSSKNDGRKYVDIGLHIDWYGALYLCSPCLHDIADSAGIFEEMRTKLEQAEAEGDFVSHLKQKGEELHDTVIKTFKEFEEFYVDLHSISVDSITESDSSVESTETTAKSGANTSLLGSKLPIKKSESGTSKPTTISGSKDFRSIADLIKEG